MEKKGNRQGHYCKICGKYKANEKFSAKGHQTHICKTCSALPDERKTELKIITRINRIGDKFPLSKEDFNLLEKYSKDKRYPDAAEFAGFILGMHKRE